MIDWTPSIIGRAISCLERAPLRASDAVHVACALESMCDSFISADRKQGEAAAHFGLKVEPAEGSH